MTNGHVIGENPSSSPRLSEVPHSNRNSTVSNVENIDPTHGCVRMSHNYPFPSDSMVLIPRPSGTQLRESLLQYSPEMMDVKVDVALDGSLLLSLPDDNDQNNKNLPPSNEDDLFADFDNDSRLGFFVDSPPPPTAGNQTSCDNPVHQIQSPSTKDLHEEGDILVESSQITTRRKSQTRTSKTFSCTVSPLKTPESPQETPVDDDVDHENVSIENNLPIPTNDKPQSIGHKAISLIHPFLTKRVSSSLHLIPRIGIREADDETKEISHIDPSLLGPEIYPTPLQTTHPHLTSSDDQDDGIISASQSSSFATTISTTSISDTEGASDDISQENDWNSVPEIHNLLKILIKSKPLMVLKKSSKGKLVHRLLYVKSGRHT